MNIVWSAQARKALRSIRSYIAKDSVFYADRTVSRIIERVELAALSPSQGHPVHEFPEKSLKEIHDSPYRIIYEICDEELRVVTVVHFKQQLKS